MIQQLHFTCPACNKESTLYLSMNPVAIVLNCPVCWASLMHDKKKIKLLTAKEMEELSKQPHKTAEPEALFDNSYKLPVPATEFNYSPPCHEEHGIITNDDIIDLKIDLAQCNNIEQFLAKI